MAKQEIWTPQQLRDYIKEHPNAMAKSGKKTTSTGQKKLSFKQSLLLKELHNYLIEQFGKEDIKTEYFFDDERFWKADYFVLSRKIAIEIEGGIFSGGRHIRPIGFINDMEKYNAMAAQGITLFRYSYTDLKKWTYKMYISSQPITLQLTYGKKTKRRRR